MVWRSYYAQQDVYTQRIVQFVWLRYHTVGSKHCFRGLVVSREDKFFEKIYNYYSNNDHMQQGQQDKGNNKRSPAEGEQE